MRQSDANTVKIRDSALGLSGFVSFFWWAYLRGAYPRRINSYVLWGYLDKPTFLGGPICGGGLSAGGRYHRYLRYEEIVSYLKRKLCICHESYIYAKIVIYVPRN